MRPLRGKRALITGAASGIGRSLAVQLAAQGVHLHLVDRDETGLYETERLASVHGVECQLQIVDLTCHDAVGWVVEAVRLGPPLDLLINNAGVAHFGPTESMHPDHMQRLMTINLLVPMRLTLELLPMLLERNAAHIVNIASIFGITAYPPASAYSASKFGLVGFSEAIEREYADRALRVTTVCPGFVATNIFAAGTSSAKEGVIPAPPTYLCTTPEIVAKKILAGIHRDRRLVLITPLAYGLYYARRFAPWLPGALRRMQRLFRR